MFIFNFFDELRRVAPASAPLKKRCTHGLGPIGIIPRLARGRGGDMRPDSPATIIDRVGERLTELESHVEQLEMIQQLMLRLLSIMHPLSNVLSQYGASATEERELMQYLDELADRVHSFERTKQPTVEEFQVRMAEILPALRQDVDFLRLVIDTLRVERSAYRDLHGYMIDQGWSGRISRKS